MSSHHAKIRNADALKKAGNFTRAEELCREALEEFPDSNAARQCLVSIMVVSERFEEAYKLLLEWLDLSPNNRSAMFSMVGAQVRLKKIREAKVSFEAFKLAHPTYVEEVVALELLILHYSEKPSRVLKRISQLRADPSIAPALSEVLDSFEINLHTKRGDAHSVATMARSVLAENPLDWQQHLRMMNLNFRQARYANTRHWAKELTRVSPQHRALAKEMTIASWLAYFPPFLVFHGIFGVLNRVANTSGARQLIMLIAAPFHIGAILFYAFFVTATFGFFEHFSLEGILEFYFWVGMTWVLLIYYAVGEVHTLFRRKTLNLSPDY